MIRKPVIVLALGLGCAALGLGFSTPLCAFAQSVVAFVAGTSAGNNQTQPIGEPTGGGDFEGSMDTLTLGYGGSLTLLLGSACFDGPGTDLIVCENPFFITGSSNLFVEAMFVEVSTDGVNFARFPTSYTGDAGPFQPFSGVPMSWYRGFAGVMPVHANSSFGIPSLDVVAAGGDAFDLADLADDPLAMSGAVNLFEIHYVRLVDVRGGVSLDSAGTPVWDSGLNSVASADVDAVIGVNSLCVTSGGRPHVEVSLASGILTIHIDDNDGFTDVKHGLTASVDGVPIPFSALLPFFVITQINVTGVTLVTGPVPLGVYPITLKVSAQDNQGLFGGDSLRLP